MEKKNPFSEASKERRRILNERNSQSTSKSVGGAENKTLTKEQLVALAAKNAAHIPGAIHQEK